MADKKSKKSSVSSSSKPSSKSQGKAGKSVDVAKEVKTKQLTNMLAKMKGKSLETILIAPADYVPVFHRDMKPPDASTSPDTSTTGEQDDKNIVSKNTSAKTKKSATQPKSQKGRTVSQKAKTSSKQIKSAARAKSAKKLKKTELLQQQPKMAKYVVQALNGRMDNFLKRYDHKCNQNCTCLKNKERKSKKKSKATKEWPLHHYQCWLLN